MTKEVPVTKRLVGLKFLQEHSDVQEFVILQKRKEKTYYPNGYADEPVVRKGIEDDYILLLKIKDSPETLGFTINHLGRELEDVEMFVGTSYRSHQRRTLTLSSKITGYENIRNSLNNFVKYLVENPDLNIVSASESYYDINLTEENKKERERTITIYQRQEVQKSNLMKENIILKSDIEEYRSSIPELLKETEEAKKVNKLRAELIEAERMLGEKYKELNKPLRALEIKEERIRQDMHKITLDMSEKATVTNIFESEKQNTNRPKMK